MIATGSQNATSRSIGRQMRASSSSRKSRCNNAIALSASLMVGEGHLLALVESDSGCELAPDRKRRWPLPVPARQPPSQQASQRASQPASQRAVINGLPRRPAAPSLSKAARATIIDFARLNSARSDLADRIGSDPIGSCFATRNHIRRLILFKLAL